MVLHMAARRELRDCTRQHDARFRVTRRVEPCGAKSSLLTSLGGGREGVVDVCGHRRVERRHTLRARRADRYADGKMVRW